MSRAGASTRPAAAPRRARGAVLGALAAWALAPGCGDAPPLTVRFAVSDAPSQRCPGTSCSQIGVRCESVLSLRILDPADPTAPFVALCQPVTGRRDLCSIAGIDLPPGVRVPYRTLEVQVALYPAAAVPVDPVSGQLACPTDLRFTPGGLIADVAPTPAIAGRAFYQPGDAETVVPLGCPDLAAVNDATCLGAETTAVAATVDDFDTGGFIPPLVADRLGVAVGEPRARIDPTTLATEYVLAASDAAPLERTVFGPVPAWGADVARRFAASACAEVVEDGARSVPSVTCRPVAAGAPRVAVRGLRLAKATLDQVLSALSLAAVPDDGLVVGVVLDYLGRPAPGVVVQPSAGTVAYLSGDRETTTGLTETSVGGLFVSRDAPYGATWTTLSPDAAQLGVGFGGRIVGKVSLVVLQLDQPTTVGQ